VRPGGSLQMSGASITVSGGIDKLGHLGFAGQPGLAPFGKDVFNNAAVKKK